MIPIFFFTDEQRKGFGPPAELDILNDHFKFSFVHLLLPFVRKALFNKSLERYYADISSVMVKCWANVVIDSKLLRLLTAMLVFNRHQNIALEFWTGRLPLYNTTTQRIFQHCTVLEPCIAVNSPYASLARPGLLAMVLP